jgi:hypothetical protein
VKLDHLKRPHSLPESAVAISVLYAFLCFVCIFIGITQRYTLAYKRHTNFVQRRSVNPQDAMQCSGACLYMGHLAADQGLFPPYPQQNIIGRAAVGCYFTLHSVSLHLDPVPRHCLTWSC